MKNEVEIRKCEKGFLVDNTTFIDNDNAEKVLSEYFFFDFWEDKEVNAFQGELNKDATFLKAIIEDPGPFGLCQCRFSYFTDVKFGAGYLKYVMLGDLVYAIFTPKDELDEIWTLHDIDEVLETAERKGNDPYEIIGKVKYIINLCNRVFIEENTTNQKEYLMHAAKEFNEYCKNHIHKKTGRNYSFEIFSEPERVKECILEYLYITEQRQRFAEAFSKDVWTEEDKNIIQNIIDYIV